MDRGYSEALPGLWQALLCSLVLGFACACTSEPALLERAAPLGECEPGEGPSEARCGTVQVFEDRDRGAGRTIELKVIVYPARSRDAQPDPVFVLAGGPGQAAAQLSSTIAGLLGDVRQNRDLVFVDQRGTGESNGLPCDLESDDLQLLGNSDHFIKTMRECLEGYDADLRFYTTPVAMDDLDEVREQLGYARINLWGGSYGTRAALVYLRRHGEHVRSIVLDGAVPLGMKLPASFAVDAQRALDLTFDACEAEDRCREQFPDLRRKFTELLDRLERQPMDVRVRHPRTGKEVRLKVQRDLVTGALRAALYNPAAASMIPMLIDQAHGRDFGGLLAQALSAESAPAESKINFGMFYSVVCAEDLPWLDNQERTLEPGSTFVGDSFAEDFGRVCAGREWGSVGEDYHEPVRSDLPALVLSGELDPVTPPRWGERLAGSLSNSRHIVVPGLGHGTVASGCVQGLIEKFVDDADGAALDDACVQAIQRPPFFVTYGGPAMTGAQ